MQKLTELVVKAIERACAGAERLAVPCSGGLDSSVIAYVASKKTKVELITLGTDGAQDVEFSKKFAEWSGLPHIVEKLTEENILDKYGKCYKLFREDLLRIELAIPVYECANLSAMRGLRTMLSGQGAEELFVGYERYYEYLDEGKNLSHILREEIANIQQRELSRNEAMAKNFEVDTLYPFLDKELTDYVLAIPLEERISRKDRGKKILLRVVARELGLPEFICERPKKAIQYGSGIHKVLIKHKPEINEKYPYLAHARTQPERRQSRHRR